MLAERLPPIVVIYSPPPGGPCPYDGFDASVAGDLNDVLPVVAKWPEEWRDSFAEREAVMAINACYPYVPAIREAFKEEGSVAERMGCQHSGL